jgi:very-short-patch-repair endonuclease
MRRTDGVSEPSQPPPTRAESDPSRAKSLRRAMTVPEKVLFAELRKLRTRGLVFRRQHPLGQFVADFYCASAKLVIEVDGPTHNRTGTKDRFRDAWMRERGISTIRFSVQEIDTNLDGVVATIVRDATKKARW